MPAPRKSTKGLASSISHLPVQENSGGALELHTALFGFRAMRPKPATRGLSQVNNVQWNAPQGTPKPCMLPS